MSLKDIDIGIKKIKSMLINDIEKQLRFLGIGYDKIYTSEEIKNGFDVNRKYKRNQVLDVLMNECQNDEAGSLLNDIKIRKKNLKKFIRECTFDFTNKFCAIRLLEERNLISPTIKKFKEYGDKSEVQKNLNRVSYALLDKDPYDGLKDAIEGTLRELSTQIKLLFELNDEHSLLFPESKTIKEITKVLLDEIPLEDWHRDDFVGWTYQYFVEDEKEEIEQADTPEEIAAKTQVYTYDWIVKYIVDNTLGSYWNEIKSGKRPHQEVETIKLIDPSCGSGSFLTYAFDKYYELYVEEGKIPEEQIPNYIISKNIFGIDIDERAVQLAALNLYIKAKEKNRNAQIEKFNIICTDSRIKGEVNIDKYLMSISIDPKLRDVIENIVRKSFDYMQENNLLGSLMKIEDVINPIIDEYVGGRRRPSIREVEAKKEKILKQSDQMTMFKPESQQLSLDTVEDIRYFESREEFVEYLRQKILDCVDYVVTKINKANDINSRMFAKDLSKGSNFIGAMMQKYEVVVGNPPYLGNRKMGKELRKIVQSKLAEEKNDLYVAFMILNYRLADTKSYIGMITPDTYLSIETLENIREFILNNTYIKTIIHLGKDTFREAVNACIMVQIKDKHKIKDSKFIDLQNVSNKSYYLLNEDKFTTGNTYFVNKRIILKLPQKKFIYWVSTNIHNIFINSKTLEPYHGIAKQGLITGNNNRFIYMRWEIPVELINNKWFPVSKGGGYNKYLGRMDFLINWANDGEELKKFAKKKYGTITRTIVGMEHYFKEGITYSKVTSESRFSARYLPKGWIFTEAGPCIFPNDYSELYYILALVNSKIANYLLYSLNPTVNFEIGDIKLLPVVEVNENEKNVCTQYVLKIMKNKDILYTYYDILSERYDSNSYLQHINNELKSKNSLKSGYRELFIEKSKIEIANEEYSFILDEYLFELYCVSDKDKTMINNKFGISPVAGDIIDEYFVEPEQPELRQLYFKGKGLKSKILINENKILKEKFNVEELILKIKKLCSKKGMNIIKIADEIKLHPRTVLSIMIKYNLYISDDANNFTRRYIQALARKAFDDDKDGIVLLPDVLNKIHDELDKTFGENASSIETEIVNIIGKSIEKWLCDDFAIDYVNNKGYDKKKDKYKEIKNPWEPLIWKGQSSKKNFTVFVWRYKITPDTELKIRSQYLDSEIESYKNKIKELDEKLLVLEGKEKSNLEKEKDEIFYILDDLNEYKEWIKENGVRLRGMWFNWE
jgi:methylase of polypeptide subunit release factors